MRDGNDRRWYTDSEGTEDHVNSKHQRTACRDLHDHPQGGGHVPHLSTIGPAGPPLRPSVAWSKGAGYSLIEAVVTIAILGILTGLILSGVITARRNAAVRSAANQFSGHLREAESLAQSGVTDPGCLDAASTIDDRRECSKYRVSFVGDQTTYVRDVVLNGTSYGAITFTLPAGAKFQGSGPTTMTFTYTPPVITVEDPSNVTLTHAAGPSTQSFVCVSSLGVIEVRPGSC